MLVAGFVDVVGGFSVRGIGCRMRRGRLLDFFEPICYVLGELTTLKSLKDIGLKDLRGMNDFWTDRFALDDVWMEWHESAAWCDACCLPLGPTGTSVHVLSVTAA